MRRLLLVAVVALVAGAFTPRAEALSRHQADAIALKTLAPKGAKGRVVVFGLPTQVRATQSVAIGRRDRQGDAIPKGLRPVTRKVWLYWEDLAYDAAFEHPSRLLLVDDATGKTVVRNLLWYPLIDGRRPAFLRSAAGYHSGRYQIYSSVKPKRKTQSASGPRRAGDAIPQNAFADDCLLMAGQYYEWHFQRDFEDLEREARSLGVRTFYATSLSNPTPRRPGTRFVPQNTDDVLKGIDNLADRQHCKDVMIYLAGHGSKDGEPMVSLGDGPSQFVLPSSLKLAMAEHPKVTFKIKIQSCYSGRFVEPLMEEPNAVLVEASSRADEPSYSALSRSGVDRDVANPGRSEFTHRNLVGMSRFAGSQAEVKNAIAAGGPLLARMLQRAFVLGAGSDGAELAGLSHGVLRVNFPAPPPPPTTTTTSLPLAVIASHEHPVPNPGYSYVCGKITSLAGAYVTLSIAGPSGYSKTDSATLGSSGSTVLRATISLAGKYTLTATASKNGQSTTKTVAYDVPSPSGAAKGPFSCG